MREAILEESKANGAIIPISSAKLMTEQILVWLREEITSHGGVECAFASIQAKVDELYEIVNRKAIEEFINNI